MLESINIENIDIELDVLPPSARAVYLILKENNPMYIGEITDHSDYSRRTIQQALNLLEKSDLVTHYPDFRDLRRHQYTIT